MHPDAVTDFRRGFVKNFDLEEVGVFGNLRRLELTRCRDLIGLSSLSRLSGLGEIKIDECSTTEPIDQLLGLEAPDGWIFTSPPPGARFGRIARRRGWVTNATETPGQFAPFEIHSEEPATIVLTDFLALDEATQGQKTEANGLLAEGVAKLVADSIRPRISVTFDSESGLMSARAQSPEDARRLSDALLATWSDRVVLAALVRSAIAS